VVWICEWYGLLTYNKVYTHQLSLSAHISMFQLLLHRSFNFTKCFLISNNASNCLNESKTIILDDIINVDIILILIIDNKYRYNN